MLIDLTLDELIAVTVSLRYSRTRHEAVLSGEAVGEDNEWWFHGADLDALDAKLLLATTAADTQEGRTPLPPKPERDLTYELWDDGNRLGHYPDQDGALAAVRTLPFSATMVLLAEDQTGRPHRIAVGRQLADLAETHADE